MDAKILNTDYSNLLKKATKVYGKQHEAIAQNIANSNTKNYKRINTDFSSQLQTAVQNSGVKVSRNKHIQHSNWGANSMDKDPSSPEGQVDIAREMTDLSVNQIRFELVTRALQRYYSGISAAIVGRNR